jgi:hypothetical protein
VKLIDDHANEHPTARRNTRWVQMHDDVMPDVVRTDAYNIEHLSTKAAEFPFRGTRPQKWESESFRPE